jgi:hypothetical protein
MSEINYGDKFKSRVGLEITVIGIRDPKNKRNILVAGTNPVTDRAFEMLLSVAEINRRYPYRSGSHAGIAYLASLEVK